MKAKLPLLGEPLLTFLVNYKTRWTGRGYDTPLLNYILCHKLKAQFGSQFSTILVGSSPLSPQTGAAIEALLDVKVLNGFGCTEASAGSTMAMASDLGVSGLHTGVPFHSVKYYLKDWSEGGYSPADKPNPRGEIVIGLCSCL